MPSDPRPPRPEWITEAEFAAMCKAKRQSLANKRSLGRFNELPPVYKFGRAIRYRLDEAIAFCESKRVDTTR
jgi:hypothetical protein